MPMEYLIEELTDKGKLTHGSKPTREEACRKVERLRESSTNTFAVSPKFVSPVSRVIAPVTGQELFDGVKSHPEALLEDQNESVRSLFDLLAEAVNENLEKFADRANAFLPNRKAEGATN